MPDYNRKPTLWEHIVMDLQHDLWNSRIKYWTSLSAMIGFSVWMFGWVL